MAAELTESTTRVLFPLDLHTEHVSTALRGASDHALRYRPFPNNLEGAKGGGGAGSGAMLIGFGVILVIAGAYMWRHYITSAVSTIMYGEEDLTTGKTLGKGNRPAQVHNEFDPRSISVSGYERNGGRGLRAPEIEAAYIKTGMTTLPPCSPPKRGKRVVY